MWSVIPSLATLVFAVSSMLTVGFSYTWSEIVGPLRNGRAVVRALVANFVLVPMLAYIIVRLLGLNEPHAVGLILLGTAAGTPFLIRLTAAAESDVGLGATLLVLLLPVTVLYMPVAVPLLVPGAVVHASAIAVPLISTMLLPLGIGLFVRARSLGWARRLRPMMAKTSSYSLLFLIASTFLINLPGILDMSMRAILAAALLVVGAFLLGYLMGGSELEKSHVLGLGTGQRNVAAATVVATQGFGSAEALTMVIVTALVGLAILFPIATKLREQEETWRVEAWMRQRPWAKRARAWAVRMRSQATRRAGSRAGKRPVYPGSAPRSTQSRREPPASERDERRPP